MKIYKTIQLFGPVMNINYVLLLLTYLLILSQSVSSGDDENCMIVTPENECLACSRGYRLNTQRFCTSIQNQNSLQYSISGTQMIDFTTQASSSNDYDINCWVRDKQGICVKCYEGYIYKSATNKCFFVGKYCNSWNSTQCLSCMRGAMMTPQNQCVKNSIKNCAKYESGECKQCEYRFVLLSGVCNRVDNGCQTWDKVGNCISCFNGFVINKKFGCQLHQDYFTNYGKNSNTNQFFTYTNVESIGKKPFQTESSTQTDQSSGLTIIKPTPLPSNCDAGTGGICLKCSFRFYNSNGKCEAVSQLCRVWSLTTGACTDCYEGYYLSGPACVKRAIKIEQVKVKVQLPPNCLQYSNGQCKKCAFKFYISKGLCSPISDSCKAWRMTGGECVDCFEGFMLSNGACIVKPKQQIKVPKIIPNCAQIGSTGLCMKCSFRYFNFNGNCIPVSDLCKSWNEQNGACTQCYDGYTLSGAQCAKRQGPLVFVPPPIIGCAEIGSNGYCFRCATRYILKNGFCQEVDNLCKNWQPINGGCTQCYQGYNLKDKSCIIAPKAQKQTETKAKVNNTMVGCAQLNQNGNCNKCIFRYVNINGKCKAVSDQCKNWSNKTAECTECFDGYSLKAGACVIVQEQKKIVIPGCAEIGSNGNCLKCAFRYYFRNGVCVAVNDQCKAWNENNGACTDCYPGYSLYNTDCVPYQVTVGVQPQYKYQSYISEISSSSNCIQIAFNGLCSKCVPRFINWNGVCKAVSDQCKTWNQFNGACTQCYKGYLISNFDCVPAKVQITFLSQIQQKPVTKSQSVTSSSSSSSSSSSNQINQNQEVTQSKAGETINSTIIKQITQDQTKDMGVQTGDPSQFQDIQYRFATSGGIEGCLQVNSKGACIKCQITHIPWKGICRLFPKQCKTWDAVNGACSTCIDDYVLSGFLCIPVQKPVSPKASSSQASSSQASKSSSSSSSSSSFSFSSSSSSLLSSSGSPK